MTTWPWILLVFFSSNISDLELKKTATWIMPMGSGNKSPNNGLLYLDKRLGESVSQERKIFDNDCSTPAKHYRRNCGPTPNKVCVGHLTLGKCWKHSSFHIGRGVRRGKGGGILFSTVW
jgi:hypothetical protein